MSQVIKEVLKQRFEKGVKEGINDLLRFSYIDHYRDIREYICSQYCAGQLNQNDCLKLCNENPADYYMQLLQNINLQNLGTLDDICDAVGANKTSVKVFLSKLFFGSFSYKDPEENKEGICDRLYNNPEKYGKKIGNEMVSHNPKVVAKALAAYQWLESVCFK